MKPEFRSILSSRAFLASAVALLAGVVLAAGYLHANARSQIQVSAVERLRIAVPSVPHMALIQVAAVNGYFVEEGLDVAIVPVDYGVVAVGQVVQGKADLAVAADVPFVIAVMKGGALGMVASLASISNDNAIIARRDHAIAAPGDLAGKRIGVSFGSNSSYFLWAFLIKNRLAPDSVTLVDVPPELIVAKLLDGSVDAVSTWQPITFQAQALLGEKAVSFTMPDAYRTTIVALGRSDFLKERGAAMQKFMRALIKAERFMQSRPEDTLNLVAKWLMIDVATLRPTWQQFDFKVNLLQSQLIFLEGEARWAMARGYVSEGPTHNFLPNLYLDALLAVQPERVTVLH